MHLSWLILVALAATGCGPWTTEPHPTPAPAVHEAVIEPAEGRDRLLVSLLDRTGIVLSIEPAVEEGPEGINFVGDDGLAFTYRWLGGACDTRHLVTFERTDSGFRLLTRTEAEPVACDAIAIPRQIVVRVSASIELLPIVVVPGQP
jgi:hypothetical protein